MTSMTAQQRAAILVLDAIARTSFSIPHTWTTSEVAEVMTEIAKIELRLRKVAVEQDARACKSLGRETGRQVRMRRIKGVK